MMMRLFRSVSLVLLLFTLMPIAGRAQATAREEYLPSPTGPYGVGRVTIHWIDESRVEPLAQDLRKREVRVDVWYPAEPTAGRGAEYLDATTFEQALGANVVERALGAAYDAVRAGRVQGYAIQDAPFSRSLERSPVLIFSHGGGAVPQIYTVQLEDLASHGYVVAAITHTYDALLTVLPGRRHIPFDTASRRAAGSSEEQSIAYENQRTEWWAGDIRFVLDELERHKRLARSRLPFAGHLDFERIGALGHSAGGLAAARACQVDRRLRACLNQDGLRRFAPFYRDERGWGMDQAFLLMAVAPRDTPPNEDELAAMNLTRTQAAELVAELKAEQDAALQNTGMGSYRVLLERTTVRHDSFSDLPLLQSNAAEADRNARILSMVNSYTRAFFDKFLRGMTAPLLDDAMVSEFVTTVDRFQAGQRPQD